MDSRFARLSSFIHESVSRLLAHDSFLSWFKSARMSPEDLIQLNNSFLYRESVNTVKSEYYLFIAVNAEGVPGAELRVGRGRALNVDFRKESHRSKVFPVTASLRDELRRQEQDVGRLVLLLAGSVVDDLRFSQEVGATGLETIILDPTAEEEVFVDEHGVVTIQNTDAPEAIWEQIQSSLHVGDEQSVETLKNAVRKTLIELDNVSYARLVFPGDPGAGTSILGDVVGVLREQKESYRSALEQCNGDPSIDRQAFNELLRISYNFASDVVGLIRLIISVCDLKPIILWGTIAEHYALAEAFRELHWETYSEKPSLGRYIDTIKDARNNAFHHLFPFSKSIQIQLDDGLQDVTLRLFSDYRRRTENELDYRDRQLVEVLKGFTRSGEKSVNPVFWHKNLEVFKHTISLFDATDGVLRVLGEALSEMPHRRVG